MRIAVLSCLIGLLLATTADATRWSFDFTAEIDIAGLRNPDEAALVKPGGMLFGRFSYSSPAFRQGGGNYEFRPGTEIFEIFTPTGYRLTLENRNTVVAEFMGVDYFTMQSFISEDPNGWNMTMDLNATGWLGGSEALPTSFPSSFNDAYLSAYFLDEADMIQVIEASILSITPSSVPLPPAGLLLAGALLWGWRLSRKAAA